MLWRILGNEQDVCDAYQDTFLQLAHHDVRRKPQHVKAYLFRTAGNVAISMLRRRAAERKRLSNVTVPQHNADSPLQEIDSKYMQENLRYCVAKLPEHLRNVIALRDLAEMSYSQVGRIMGISPATARVYRCKAVQLLAFWMGRKEKNHGCEQEM
jgi:RNA polymerase sigma-70 factor (ECF subfamily)